MPSGISSERLSRFPRGTEDDCAKHEQPSRHTYLWAVSSTQVKETVKNLT